MQNKAMTRAKLKKSQLKYFWKIASQQKIQSGGRKQVVFTQKGKEKTIMKTQQNKNKGLRIAKINTGIKFRSPKQYFLQFQIFPRMADKRISKFLRKMFEILDKHEYSDIISWDLEGERIIIKDQEKMEQLIIPSHFSLRKFSSFVRQLHLYNFHKQKSKCYFLIFRNPQFLRQQRELATEVVRKRKTKAQQKQSSQTRITDNSPDKLDIFAETSQAPAESQKKDIKSQQQSNLDGVALKSYSKLEDLKDQPFDIMSLLEIL